MNKSFNVLQCMSQPTWHFNAYNNKCSLVAKKVTGISLSSICHQPHLEVSRKRNETSYLFPSFLSVFVEAWIWLENSKMNLQRILTYFLQKSSSDSNLIVRKVSWVPISWSTCLNYQVSLSLFQGKQEGKQSKKKKIWLVFSTVSVEQVIKT